MFDAGPLYLENLNAPEKTLVNQGGTSSGKTYSIMQLLYFWAITRKRFVITVIGESIPNLKKGAYRDAETIYALTPELEYYIASWNKTERIIYFKNGSIIEFTSYETEQSAKNGKRDVAFFNEANGIGYKIYWQVARRTRFKVILDYNPTAEFWAHEKVIGQANTRLIISDHRHNLWLTPEQHQEIEDIRNEDEELWKVYARGLTGKIEGLVFQKVFKALQLPEGAKYLGTGLDFGFTNDPTSAHDLYLSGGELYIDEILYDPGLTNDDIYKLLTDERPAKRWSIVADSSEPKSIEELKRLGLPIEGAQKGPGSVNAGIDVLKRYNLNLLPSCVSLKKELDRYKWKVDKTTGKTTNEPIDTFNHAIDAVRYVAQARLQNPQPKATRAKVKKWR
ncbi:PBSX family phage terminase large subunit [Hymenobacter fodinae]|uniref:Terminase n=1 Tax=Hymenobacter fodinae TaxID=2510796 RepID=A0A4Z0P8N5_9BACT|nr:terminase large subunit [Hymenobacter fodinae]TGE08764.1 terminase [Hymenobacter fodinae]